MSPKCLIELNRRNEIWEVEEAVRYLALCVSVALFWFGSLLLWVLLFGGLPLSDIHPPTCPPRLLSQSSLPSLLNEYFFGLLPVRILFYLCVSRGQRADVLLTSGLAVSVAAAAAAAAGCLATFSS